MSRKQRVRVCGNLMQLMYCAQSPAARRVYRKQLERTAARLKGGE
jgi:hypothetical protein